MTGRYLVELADVLRAAGLSVVEQDGWQGRARSSGGYADGRPWCVMWHHTASSPNADPASDAAYMSYNADAAPIANIMPARDGTVWVLAAGATNTNGKGVARTFTRGTVPADSMNTYAVGMEIQNSGTGQTYDARQVDACFRASLAITDWLGLDPTDVDLHWLYAPGRKVDPATAAAVDGPWSPGSGSSSGSWVLDDVRAELRRRAAGPPPTEPPPPEDDDMLYIATLNDGRGLIVGSTVRPVSAEEQAPGGPFADLPRYTPDPASYWHAWLAAGANEYTHRVGMD